MLARGQLLSRVVDFFSWSGTSGWVWLNASTAQLSQLGFADFDGDGRADGLSRQSP
jgi:hypothetical protein